MRYRVLGSTGPRVSVVGVGTWQFGGEWGRAYTATDAEAIFDAARACGINLTDTAECYGDHESERLIGAAVERDRDRWVIATKVGHKFHKPFERTEPREPADIVRQVDDSLAALRTDRVELLQYHSWGDSDFFRDDVHAEMLRLRDRGKALHLGNSVGDGTNVRQVAASRARGIEAIQIIYNRLDRRPEDTTFPVCVEQNLGVLARVPLASGLLSGKYKPGHTFDANEVRGRWVDDRRDERLREVERMQREEVPPGVPMARWALAWVLRHPAVTCVIPGCKDAQQVRDNAAAAELDPALSDHPQAV